MFFFVAEKCANIIRQDKGSSKMLEKNTNEIVILFITDSVCDDSWVCDFTRGLRGLKITSAGFCLGYSLVAPPSTARIFQTTFTGQVFHKTPRSGNLIFVEYFFHCS